MVERVSGIGSEAVENGTGFDWDYWFEYLDSNDAVSLQHPEIVSMLKAAGIESGWWQQTVAVAYEQERGLREVGQTADAGYQVGCQRTINIPQTDLWELLTDPEGQELWLGNSGAPALEPGTEYETAEGIRGEIRTRTDCERLRLTWQPPGWARPSTLQITLSCPRNDTTKTTLRFHQEHLADAATREAMRSRWQSVLDGVEDRVAAAP